MAETSQGIRSVVATINFLSSDCDKPSVDNGDFTKNVFPLESSTVQILDGDSFDVAPSLEVEGFCRVSHPFDISGLADSQVVMASFRASLGQLAGALMAADEVHMLPFSMVRQQAAATIGKDIERGVVADFVHSDSTEAGAPQAEGFFYPPPQPGRTVERTVQLNMWRLLSSTPTPVPLALCDARSLRPGDITAGPAYFPSVDGTIDTAFFHPNDHFRWVYFSRLTNQELLVFKQYDSDARFPQRVPHTAFKDTSCPPDADPRVSIENRCLLRWYA